MSVRLPHAPLSERKRKAPGMVKEIHGVLVARKRVHLWGPRFADVGVYHTLQSMFDDMAPVQIDSSGEESVPPPVTLVPDAVRLAQETVDILEPLEQELRAKMSRDGQLATSIDHMNRALQVVRERLEPARDTLHPGRCEGNPPALTFDSSDVARLYEKVVNLFATMHLL